ncbi:MAG TPA: type II toxin-antitoxin system HipA family toxin [Desulfobacterales bacterium]|nr:type II toxin-antitoxin system HipA family toxin [Desulfobacterales bacterium]
MKAEVNLYVHALFTDGRIVLVGRLLSRNLYNRGNYEGFFRYDEAYLRNPLAYPLDPVHLPLDNGVFTAVNRELGMPEVFDDSLPDAWGRHILARKGGLEPPYAPAHLLLALGGSGLGRLLFSESEVPPTSVGGSIDFADIAKAITEASALEDSIAVDNAELRHLLACGSSAGGARPKVLTILDDDLWLAKFTSRQDPHPELFVALEEAGLILARRAGLEVPEIRRERAAGRDILLIRRFDVTPTKGRNALVSFRTLIGVEDHYSVSYADLAGIVSRFSHRPKDDLEGLYRQMIVNIALVNTDDHLQNFAMLHTRQGWRLSPAYDIVPNIYQGEQILLVNGKHQALNRDDILREGRKFGLSKQRCGRILTEVAARLATWPEVFTACRVPEEHTGNLRLSITRRLKMLHNCQ